MAHLHQTFLLLTEFMRARAFSLDRVNLSQTFKWLQAIRTGKSYLCQSIPFMYLLAYFHFDGHEVSDHHMTYLHFMSVLHIRLACSLEMMMHITLIKIRKFTWRNEKRIYIIIKKHVCLSVQKSWFVYACVGLCALCYSAATEFAMELNSLLRNCALNTSSMSAQITFENAGTSLNKAGELTYISGESDIVKVWAGPFALSGGLRLTQYCGCRTWHFSTVPHHLLLFCSSVPGTLSSASLYHLP